MTKRPASRELIYDPKMARKFSYLRLKSHDLQDDTLSILENPKLGFYVRYILANEINGGSHESRASKRTTPEFEQQKENTFRTVIAEQKWDEPDATGLLRRLMENGSALGDAVAALLLPILPNVEN